jgi:hypothetical protein
VLKPTASILALCLAVCAAFAAAPVSSADAAGPDPVLIPAPISLYRFDEATGATTIDDSVRGAAGLGDLHGAPTFEPGKVDNAICLDGSSQYATAPLVGNGLSEFTIAAWVKIDQSTTWGTIAKNWGEVSTGAFHFGLNNTTGRWSNFIGQVSVPGSTASVLSPNDAPLDQWQYLVTTVSQSAGRIELYEDGVQVNGSSFNDTISSFSTVMSFGVKLNDAQNAPAPPTATGWLDGCLDEIAFWDVALSPEQIAAVIASDTGVPENGSTAPAIVDPSAGQLAQTGTDPRIAMALFALAAVLGAAGIAATAHSRRAAGRGAQ